MKRRDTIVRYTAPERINHWVTAFCFVLAAVSGLGFFFPSFNWLMHILGTPQLARILHPFVGVVMFASFIIMFFRYWHHNLINRDDIFWAKNIRKIVVNEEVGDTGRYNFGQKCVFWAAIIFLVLLLVSGVIIWRPYFAPHFLNPGDPICADAAFICRSGVNCGYHGAYLRRPLGERHHYRDGGRLGYQNVGEETSPALVPRGPPETGKVI